MARIVVQCQGRAWQDDFAPLTERLYRYLRHALRRALDAEECVQEAICFIMEEFSRKWNPAKELVVFTSRAMVKALEGRRFVRRAEMGWTRQMSSVQATRPLWEVTAAAGGSFTRYLYRDLIADADAIAADAGRLARFLMMGFNIRTARKLARVGPARTDECIAAMVRRICRRERQ